jgi:hypothetical protein
MTAEFYCDICNAPMELKEKLANHKKGAKEYRRRRFKCSVCDYEKTIFADGALDEKFIPNQGIAVAKAIAKKESENREI